MSFQQRVSFFLFVDSILILGSVYLGKYLLFGLPLNPGLFLFNLIILLLGHYFLSFVFSLYKKSWEFASIGEMLVILRTVIANVLVATVVQVLMFGTMEYRLMIITGLLYLISIGISRFVGRIYHQIAYSEIPSKKRTLIIGAGSAGTMIAKQLLNSKSSKLKPIAFIDDDRKKHHLDIFGIRVVGGTKKIVQAVESLDIEHIIIAIPSMNKQVLNRIFHECGRTGIKTQIMPLLEDLLIGNVSVRSFRDIHPEDLLGREPVQLNEDAISESLTGKVVIVTGAGGSIGSEICRQLMKFFPKRLILLGHGENSIYTIEMELKEQYGNTDTEILTEIADIQDFFKMKWIMDTYRPDTVYHAAAHKHVPLMENNPEEAIKNNLIGTKNVAEAAGLFKVGTFVMISSDKAVNPTSVMGATKRLSEMLIQNLNGKSQTKFVAVRFGNVLGSRGSVIPLFKKQIENGGPVTVTHPDMVRYFMTIPESARLVLQAGALAKGGEIFVLDMGLPVKIIDLAKSLILLSGRSLDDIPIEFTGIRPGEKLFEELLNKEEMQEEQIHPHIYIGRTGGLYIHEIEELLEDFKELDKETLRARIVTLANLPAIESQMSMPS